MFLLREWSFLVFLACLALSVWAHLRLLSARRHYGRALNSRKTTASSIAKSLLKTAGAADIDVRLYPGELTDHYDPKDRVVHLSSPVYDSRTIASIGVAAHEAGHAIQDRDGNQLYRLRNKLIPVTNIVSYVAIPLFVIGLIANVVWLTHFGEYLFIGVVIFHTFTLPLEIEAGKKSHKILADKKMLAPDELDDVSEVLHSVALTYISIAFTSLFHLIRLIVLSHKE